SRWASWPLGCPEALTAPVAADDPQAVAAGADVARRDRSACRARARSRFGADRMVEDYLAIYRDLVG
ncbi:glycosyltransferase family 4 protein, partial [Actinoplanes sp. NPDC048791]